MKKPAPEFPPWSATKIWPNSTVFILGGGPSLNDVDFGLIEDQKIIGVNNAYGTRIADENNDLLCYFPRPWVDACFFGDSRWFEWHSEWLSTYANNGGLVVSAAPTVKRVPWLKFMVRGKPAGIEANPSRISWNRSSGGAAINLAYHLGARKIVLLGYDMQAVKGKKNWHEDHKVNVCESNTFHRFSEPFIQIEKDARKLNIEIINATPNSALKVFPIMTLEDVLAYG